MPMKNNTVGEDIIGEVIHGKQLGRTIGFPTANIALTPGDLTLAPGTYGLKGEVRGEVYYGIGVYLEPSSLFEAHFFNFSLDIYGETIRVTPLFFIRENQRFDGLEALKAQIEADREVMRDWIEKNT